MVKKQIGCIYYKNFGINEMDICRLYNIDEKDECLIILNDNEMKEVSFDYLDSYIRLKEDGFVIFTILAMGPVVELYGRDIGIYLYRTNDLKDGIHIPYASCRQNIFDLYTNTISCEDKIFLGMSISKDTTPDGTRYEHILSCHDIEYKEEIAIYLDDDIDTILSFLKDMDRFNNILYKNYISLGRNNDSLEGLESDLKSLLESTFFMCDFRRAFNINKVHFNIKLDDTTLSISDNQINYFENLLKIKMNNVIAVEYNKTIDLDYIVDDYLLVSDLSNKLYIIKYNRSSKLKYYNNSNSIINI